MQLSGVAPRSPKSSNATLPHKGQRSQQAQGRAFHKNLFYEPYVICCPSFTLCDGHLQWIWADETEAERSHKKVTSNLHLQRSFELPSTSEWTMAQLLRTPQPNLRPMSGGKHMTSDSSPELDGASRPGCPRSWTVWVEISLSPCEAKLAQMET